MGMTMTQKILAAHSGEAAVTAGQLINAKLDMVFLGPLIDMARFDRRRIVAYIVLGCVHHNKNASFKAFGSRFGEVKINRPPKAKDL